MNQNFLADPRRLKAEAPAVVSLIKEADISGIMLRRSRVVVTTNEGKDVRLALLAG